MCFDAGKIGFCHCAAVLQTQVQKLCTDLDVSLLYISILGTYDSLSARAMHSLMATILTFESGLEAPNSGFRTEIRMVHIFTTGKQIDSRSGTVTAWTTSLAHNWAQHSCFPPSPPVCLFVWVSKTHPITGLSGWRTPDEPLRTHEPVPDRRMGTLPSLW